jgi:internalin A
MDRSFYSISGTQIPPMVQTSMESKRLIFSVLALWIAAALFATARAQQISIADPGLETAIREALQKPIGPLSEQDLLTLFDLDASGRGVTNLAGLDGAHRLTVLNLQSNRLANLSFPSGLTNLSLLDLSFNPLTNCTFPSGLTNLTGLIIEESGLVSLRLPADMTNLISLRAFFNQLTNVVVPPELKRLGTLDLAAEVLSCCAGPVSANQELKKRQRTGAVQDAPRLERGSAF